MARKKKAPSSHTAPTPAPTKLPLIRRLWPYLALAVLALGVYSNVLRNGFVSDDSSELLNNPLVVDYHKLPRIFQQDAWAFANAGKQHSNYFRPLKTTIYMGMYYLVGFSAPGFHLLLMLLHLANTLLVFQLARHFLRHLQQPRAAALVAAALFAVHPVHDEAVVWVAAIVDPLFTMLGLTMLALFIRQNAAPRKWQIVAHCALFLSAMFAKETAVMIVPLLAGYEWLYLGRSWRELFKNFAFYLGLGLTFGLYLALRLHALGSLAPAQHDHFHLHGFPLALSIVVLIGQYLSYLVLPRSLCYFHVFEPTRTITPWVILSLLAIAAIVAFALWMYRRRPEILYGLLFIFAPLLPVMNVNGISGNVFTERYLYLPSVGFVWIAAEAWEWLWIRQRRIAEIALAGVLVCWCYMVWVRTPDWYDDNRLYDSAERMYPDSATILLFDGDRLVQQGDLEAALRKYRAGALISPNEPQLHNAMGSLLQQLGRSQEAVVEYRQAVALQPDFPEGFLNLGIALKSTGEMAPAMAAEETALRLRPNYPEAMNAIGLVHREQKDYPAAVASLQQAIAANPAYIEAYFNLGVVYSDMERYQDAMSMFRKVVESGTRPSYEYLAHYGLGVCYTHMNSLPEAAAEFRKTLALQPGFDRAQRSLDAVRAAMFHNP